MKIQIQNSLQLKHEVHMQLMHSSSSNRGPVVDMYIISSGWHQQLVCEKN